MLAERGEDFKKNVIGIIYADGKDGGTQLFLDSVFLMRPSEITADVLADLSFEIRMMSKDIYDLAIEKGKKERKDVSE